MVAHYRLDLDTPNDYARIATSTLDVLEVYVGGRKSTRVKEMLDWARNHQHSLVYVSMNSAKTDCMSRSTKADYMQNIKNITTIEETPVKKDQLLVLVKPYQKYILIAAVLYVADRLIFKGRFTDSLLTLASTIFERLFGILDAAAKQIGGPDAK